MPNDTTPRLAKARLLTRGGDFVCCADVLPFNEWPNVLTWGLRIFVHEKGETEDDVATYREAFSWAAVNVTHDDPGES